MIRLNISLFHAWFTIWFTASFIRLVGTSFPFTLFLFKQKMKLNTNRAGMAILSTF